MSQQMHSSDEQDPADEVSPPGNGGGVLGWVLVVATAVPLLLLLEGSRQFLSGDLDERYFGFYAGQDPDADRVVPYVERWYSFTYTVPTTQPLLATALGIVVVTGLLLLGRPRPLVPPVAARWVAFGVAVVAAVAALLVALAALLAVSEEPTVEEASGGSSATYVSFPEVVGPVGVSLLTGVVFALAATVLARPPSGRRTAPGADGRDEPVLTVREPPPGHVPDLVHDPVPVPVSVPGPVSEPGPDDSGGERPDEAPRRPAFPQTAVTDLDLYRRH